VFVAINPGDPRSIYVQIIDEVRRRIVMQTLLPDEPLPSVRQLAVDLGINPNTVRQAYRELERDGWLYVKRGEGTFVSQKRIGEREIARLRGEVAERAWRDAQRHGMRLDDLLAALRALDTSNHDGARAESGGGRPEDGEG
jgi:GntR family transcriptional regulator